MRCFTPLISGLLVVATGCGGSDDDDGPSTITLTTEVPASEGGGDVIITAQRIGGSGGRISLAFATVDGSAVESSDYAASSGSVTWEDGDTEPKTITVPLVDDVTVEQSEQFVIELDPSEGAILDTTTLEATIVDDDGPGDKFGVTSAGRLVHFASNEYGRLSWAVELSGLQGDTVRAIDMRPIDGKLYALTDGARLYVIDPMTGVATAVSTLTADPADPTTPYSALPPADLSMDFDPLTDRLRIVSTTGENFRVDVDSGRVTTDATLNGQSTGYAAAAHTNNIAPACRTTLYAIDVATKRFVIQAPDTGTTTGAGGLGVDATAASGFDIVTAADGKSTAVALLAVGGVSGSYAVDLGTGKATLHREVGPLAPGESIVSFAMTPLPATAPAYQNDGELFGVSATQVISFNRASPGRACTSQPITGLAAGETVLSADIRPTGGLYVLTKVGTAGKLRRLSATTGSVSNEIPISVALQGTSFGMDFDPTGAVPLRILSNTGQNIRVTNVDTGAAVVDSALNGASSTATDLAYTDSLLGAGATSLYVIDATSDRLLIQNPPNSGTLVAVGSLGTDITGAAGFDIDGRDNTATVVVTGGASSQLHTIDLATGALSPSLGTIIGAPLLGVGRAAPEVSVYGITSENRMVRISLTNPSMVTVVQDPMAMPPVDTIAGLAPTEQLVGIDTHPSNGAIYGVTNLGGVYAVNSYSARASLAGKLVADPMDTSNPFTALSGAAFGIDFDPTGLLRMVSTDEQNLRINNVAMPRVHTDGTLVSTIGAVDVTAAAYTNTRAPSGSTLYVIDGLSGQLMIQSPPNSGALTVVGPLAASGTFSDPAMPSHAGFDIAGGNNGVALATFQRPAAAGGLEPFSRLYRIDLETGAATEIGSGIGGAPLRGLAIHVR